MLCLLGDKCVLKELLHFRMPDLLCLLLQAGVPLRLFHKEIEAYLCAEGLFDDEITEDGIIIISIIYYRVVYIVLIYMFSD